MVTLSGSFPRRSCDSLAKGVEIQLRFPDRPKILDESRVRTGCSVAPRGRRVDVSVAPGCQLLFVYGSLKRGFANHHFLAGQRFLGEVMSEPRFRLYDCGGFPGAVDAGPKAGHAIRGELWKVDDACLVKLDWLEDVAAGLYRRAWTRVSGVSRAALVYLLDSGVAGLPEVGETWTKERDLVVPSEVPDLASAPQN